MKNKMDIINEILSLKIAHFECGDNWYSCPKSLNGCDNDLIDGECNCGADEHNAKVDVIIEKIKEEE